MEKLNLGQDYCHLAPENSCSMTSYLNFGWQTITKESSGHFWSIRVVSNYKIYKREKSYFLRFASILMQAVADAG